ncbi:hypothetical protein ADU59_27410 [Pararhizobium polonicum]|uniref:Uncharacterized protein n=1 Tax=Pararhizobium polonicum TaxID=1612624 RepID=A0A1C7NTA9_9HYPH|nr:hypothetical protein [Pararhizobium polonicum]OBZ92231.1 hypothetical protein ADU59_27410 [Pararhizobium polonicum]
MSEKFAVEINNDNGEVDVILGHGKHILRGYRRDNVKMVGGWYFSNIALNTEFLSSIIDKHSIKRLNFIGTSKSCSGAIVLTKELIRKFPKVTFNLFLFSAYTTVDREVYIRRNIEDRAPGSLVSFWESEQYTPKAIRRCEARGLVNKDNVFVYMFYPEKSKYGESQLAKRVVGSNIMHIGMPVWLHNTLYPLWKKVEGNMTIEIYESEFREMHPTDFDFYTKLQNYECYRFDLYSCVENIDRFVKHLEAFKADLAAEQRESTLIE